MSISPLRSKLLTAFKTRPLRSSLVTPVSRSFPHSLPSITSVSLPRNFFPLKYYHPRAFATTTASSSEMSSFYSLKATLPGNKEYDFAQLKGKVVLIVNVASAWYVLVLQHLVSIFKALFQWIHTSIQRFWA